MVLFDDIVYLFDLPKGDRAAMRIIVTPDGRGMRLHMQVRMISFTK
jgi:hypothetical protein